MGVKVREIIELRNVLDQDKVIIASTNIEDIIAYINRKRLVGAYMIEYKTTYVICIDEDEYEVDDE